MVMVMMILMMIRMMIMIMIMMMMMMMMITLSLSVKVWGVDSTGQVYMRLGSLLPPPAHAVPVWLAVPREESLPEDCRMEEVVVSSAGTMVWARDHMQRVYAREGVYPDLPLGTGIY